MTLAQLISRSGEAGCVRYELCKLVSEWAQKCSKSTLRHEYLTEGVLAHCKLAVPASYSTET